MQEDNCKKFSLRVDDLGYSIGQNTILDKVNLKVACGELLAIVGPNGAGKTTLLKAILGELSYSGSVKSTINNLQNEKYRIGFVPQKLNIDLDIPITVMDFLLISISNFPLGFGVNALRKKQIIKALEQVAALHLIDRKIGQLSGGELQRVLLSAAITPLPDLLLLDEPVSGVDPDGLALFYKIVNGLRKDHHISIIIVTHDIAGIAAHADNMLLLNKTVVAHGKPEEVLANEKLMLTFGPNLWNVAAVVDFNKFNSKKEV